ncbi:MAG: hypothetical protein AAFV86_15905, partial [Pseudomonadota bacterium]
DEAIPAGDVHLLGVLAAIYASAMLARAGLKFAIIYLRARTAEIVARCLRHALVDAQRRRPAGEAHRALGVATSVLTTEVEPIGGFAAEALNTPLIQGGTMLGVLGFLAVAEPLLAAIAAAALAVEVVFTPVMQHLINRLTRRRIRALRHAGGAMIAAAETGAHRRLVGTLRDVRIAYALRLRQAVLKGALKVGLNLVDHAADIAVLAVGALMVIEGRIELGVIVAFLAGLREMRGPWSQLIGFYRRLSDTWIKFRLVERAIFRPAAAPGDAAAGPPAEAPHRWRSAAGIGERLDEDAAASFAPLGPGRA